MGQGILKRLTKIGSKYVLYIFVAQAGDRKHEHIMESIERFGKEVLPDFKERHETVHRKWREEQLDGVDFPINSSI